MTASTAVTQTDAQNAAKYWTFHFSDCFRTFEEVFDFLKHGSFRKSKADTRIQKQTFSEAVSFIMWLVKRFMTFQQRALPSKLQASCLGEKTDTFMRNGFLLDIFFALTQTTSTARRSSLP